MAKKELDADAIAREQYMAAVTEVNALRKVRDAKTVEWQQTAAKAQQLDNERYKLNQQVAEAEQREKNARGAFTVCSLG